MSESGRQRNGRCPLWKRFVGFRVICSARSRRNGIMWWEADIPLTEAPTCIAGIVPCRRGLVPEKDRGR